MKRPNIKCPYCGSRAFLRPASVLDKCSLIENDEKYYVCARYPLCNSYVKAHRHNQMPMGTLANRELRTKRQEAHRAMQELIDCGLMSRKEVYHWLQIQLGLPQDETHIAKFSNQRCDQVILLCHQFCSAKNKAA